MSGLSHGAAAGAALGVVAVVLGQQIGWFPLSMLGPALEDVILGAVIGSVVFGLLGWLLGRRYSGKIASK